MRQQRRDPKELGAAEMNKWRSMAIPKAPSHTPRVPDEPAVQVTGTKYQQLKDKYRPQTAPPKSRGGVCVSSVSLPHRLRLSSVPGDTSLEFGTDPRFSSQVGCC